MNTLTQVRQQLLPFRVVRVFRGFIRSFRVYPNRTNLLLSELVEMRNGARALARFTIGSGRTLWKYPARFISHGEAA